MTDNKYKKAFYEWVKLGDDLMGHMNSEEVIPALDLYKEKATEFEAAFEKAEKWDQWSMGHYRMTTRKRLRELIQTEKKFKAVKKWHLFYLCDPNLNTNAERAINELSEILGDEAQ